MDGVVVGNICYKMLYKVGSGVNFDDANSLCSFHGATLAEIPTQQVYDAIFNYLRNSWFYEIADDEADYNFVNVWLNYSYNVSKSYIGFVEQAYYKLGKRCNYCLKSHLFFFCSNFINHFNYLSFNTVVFNLGVAIPYKSFAFFGGSLEHFVNNIQRKIFRKNNYCFRIYINLFWP